MKLINLNKKTPRHGNTGEKKKDAGPDAVIRGVEISTHASVLIDALKDKGPKPEKKATEPKSVEKNASTEPGPQPELKMKRLSHGMGEKMERIERGTTLSEIAETRNERDIISMLKRLRNLF